MAENLPHHTPAATKMASADWEAELPERLCAQFPDIKSKSYLDQHWIECRTADIQAILLHLRDHEQFDMLTDLTAVDHPPEPERFEVIYMLYSFPKNERVRVKVRASAEQEVPSSVSVYPGANWLEREVYDMFGIRFSGHPNLKRILLPEDWTGFPLLKEKSIIDVDKDWVQRNLGIESEQS